MATEFPIKHRTEIRMGTPVQAFYLAARDAGGVPLQLQRSASLETQNVFVDSELTHWKLLGLTREITRHDTWVINQMAHMGEVTAIYWYLAKNYEYTNHRLARLESTRDALILLKRDDPLSEQWHVDGKGNLPRVFLNQAYIKSVDRALELLTMTRMANSAGMVEEFPGQRAAAQLAHSMDLMRKEPALNLAVKMELMPRQEASRYRSLVAQGFRPLQEAGERTELSRVVREILARRPKLRP